MTTAEKLTSTLFKLADVELKRIDEVKSVAARTGIIIQALRVAVSKAHIYLWNGTPHFFNGKIYVPVSADEFKGCVFDALSKAALKPADFVYIEKVQRIALQAVCSKPLQLRKDIIVFENCVVVLPDIVPTDEVQVSAVRRQQPAICSHSPELAQTTMCHFDFDPNADCPRWKNFLLDVLENAQLRMVLQEFLGCLFVDRRKVKLEKMLILVGNGSNGKGVISETIRRMIGKDSTTAYGLDSLLMGSESLHNIAKMNGMRVNWCTEIQALQAGRFSDKLKTLVSGEPIECRQIYGLPFTATDIPIMVANCNALPPLQDKSYGMQRRFIIIRFSKTIEQDKQDKMLLKKLEPEYPGIFNWILEGRQRFIDLHLQFTACNAIDDEVQSYINAVNNVEEWAHIKTYAPVPAKAEEDTPYFVKASTLYDEYRRWCISESIRPFSRVGFGKAMTAMGFGRTRSSRGDQYRLYGEHAFAMASRKKAEEITAKYQMDGTLTKSQEVKNGIIYDIGDTAASKQWHLSRPYLTILRRKGYLEGVYKVENRWINREGYGRVMRPAYVYDHYRLGRRIEEAGAYDGEKYENLSERRKDSIRRATAFNEEMKAVGKPFRKLVGRGGKYPPDSIFVDSDWEYTPDAAEILISRQLKKEDKKRHVKVGKDGKMRNMTKKEILAEAMAAKIENDPLYDTPDDEQLVELDIDDTDLTIGTDTEEVKEE